MVLLDAGLGGGRPFDWSLLQGFDRPYFLAGGLTAENVGEALAATGAAYVDASSGLETDGKKDPAKMAAFMQAVHAWDAANPRLSFLESLHPEFHGEDETEG
jgi:phosphoribosylanthranilate isomerase